jgi:hypothetical protein
VDGGPASMGIAVSAAARTFKVAARLTVGLEPDCA